MTSENKTGPPSTWQKGVLKSPGPWPGRAFAGRSGWFGYLRTFSRVVTGAPRITCDWWYYGIRVSLLLLSRLGEPHQCWWALHVSPSQGSVSFLSC